MTTWFAYPEEAFIAGHVLLKMARPLNEDCIDRSHFECRKISDIPVQAKQAKRHAAHCRCNQPWQVNIHLS